MNLLPFDLETALKHPDRVVYRNGEKPLEWYWFEKSKENAQKIASISPEGYCRTHYECGSGSAGLISEDDLLLIPPPEKRYWVNINNFSGSLVSTVYDNELNAIGDSRLNAHSFVKTISFTI